MANRKISDQKLMAIAREIRKQDIMELAINLGLSAADVDNDALNCFTVLRKAMNATTIKVQKNKLRKALIKSGYIAAADKHLPLRECVVQDIMWACPIYFVPYGIRYRLC